jgi:hypothetical protein
MQTVDWPLRKKILLYFASNSCCYWVQCSSRPRGHSHLLVWSIHADIHYESQLQCFKVRKNNYGVCRVLSKITKTTNVPNEKWVGKSCLVSHSSLSHSLAARGCSFASGTCDVAVRYRIKVNDNLQKIHNNHRYVVNWVLPKPYKAVDCHETLPLDC